MKKLIFLILVMPLVFGCNSKQKEYESLQAKYDSLMSIGFTKDTALYGYIQSFNDIQSNLDSIKQAEMLISKNTEGNGELQTDQKEQINRDINMIYEMLQKNKQTIAELRSKLKKSGGKVTELEKMINRMAQQIDEKDSQINQLRDQLEKMNIQIEILSSNVSNLTAEGEAKTQTITEQTTALNTAYYVVGTKRELLDHNIITREGGFAGIGANKKLKQDFSRDYFTPVDITLLRSIPLTKKRATIITTHPSQSYKLYGEKVSDSLVITNPKEFWSVSKYLVIMID
ncbi:MAG: hypothetical protein ACM3PX_09675 [Omnitrophica WOR_2 bacterium]|jgi:hypothetical protein